MHKHTRWLAISQAYTVVSSLFILSPPPETPLLTQLCPPQRPCPCRTSLRALWSHSREHMVTFFEHLTSQTSGGKFSVYCPTIISGLQALTQHSPPQFLSSPTLSTVLPHTQKLLHEYLLNWIVRPILYILVNFSNFVPVWKIEKKNWPCHQVWALTLPLTICATQQAT